MPVSLHTQSWYSLLEGVSGPDALLQRAAELGYTALALTDSNNLYGAHAFVDQAFRHGIRPLVGACLRHNRSRCVALIAEQAGYRSLCRVLSKLNLQDTGPCRLDSDPAGKSAGSESCCHSAFEDLLCTNAEGLHVLVDDVVLAERLREVFGRCLWLELVRPRTALDGVRHEEELLACGRYLDIKVVASTAVHFATSAEYPTYRLVTAVRQRTLLDRLPAQLPITPEHYLVAPDELRRHFRDLPEAVRNGDVLAELLRSDVLPRDLVLPEPYLSHRRGDLTKYLRHLCDRGLRQRDLSADLEARGRLCDELAIIEAANLSGYFLTVRDIARYARRRGHAMALRGSAGNSLVCYLLGITDVDPLRFNLPLERFLHPGRTDLPDIDLDFDWKVRDEVIAHVVHRHGREHTAQISSHLFFQPRSAFREAGRVHGLSNEQISELLTTFETSVDELLLPARIEEFSREPLASAGPALARGLRLNSSRLDPPPPSTFPLEAERWPRLLADARRLLGRPHHLSIHPGGVVITPGPIAEYVPLQWAAKGVVITQFDKDAIEQAGLVKIDLLGNRALATVEEARRIAHDLASREHQRPESATRKRQRPEAPVADAPGSPFDDGATLDLLRRGDTLGVCQLESPAMRHLLIQMQPRGLDDVIQALALLRPAAASIGMKECFIRRRHGLDAPRALHPSLQALLHETHGLMIYEDDALRLLQALTGLPAADADRFRKRIAKHETAEEAELLRTEFLALCDRKGIPGSALAELWVQLSKFNRYSFCKSHAVSYGLIAWEAAHLKTHHPLAFWTAALNNNQGAYPRRVYVEAIKRAGLELRLPCVNRSASPFRVEDNAIRVGLDAIACLPEELRTQLLADREAHGPFRDLAEFRRRLQPGPEALALLIRCGALDWTGRPRPALFLDAELQDRTRPAGAELFPDHAATDWAPADYSTTRRLRDEWQLLGFVVGPPLFSLFRPLKTENRAEKAGKVVPLITSRDLPAYRGRMVRVQGVVATGRHVLTEDGRPLQFVTLEDEHGLIEVTLFPGTCPQVPYMTIGPYLATGTVDEQYGVYTVTARAFDVLPCEYFGNEESQ
jgi:DNA-directed DNA polymerase III PolC